MAEIKSKQAAQLMVAAQIMSAQAQLDNLRRRKLNEPPPTRKKTDRSKNKQQKASRRRNR